MTEVHLAATLFGHRYQFRDVKDVLAKANEDKSGDHLAGIAAESSAERMAARYVLSEITLETLRANPAVPYEQDEITRLIDDAVNESAYADIKGMQVGELREWLLADTTTEEMIKRLSNGLTAEMVAAVTKLMSNLDLMLAASKIRVVRHCNNTIGLRGTLGSRCQPNNQTDSVEGIRAAIYEGLSFGSGDSVIGINPSDDSLGSVSRLLEMTHEVITRWEIPTQNCLLAHVSTQMEAMRTGAPLGLVFQSLAGSQQGN
ncbi:MAG TPA: ethanolamine ammonia-lyase subunit EutB, partial [Kineosporiaceae bacterium]|nr:ethanolamine ammonia-lyase subunit EutB [Kineosporiaceae bacterium]